MGILLTLGRLALGSAVCLSSTVVAASQQDAATPVHRADIPPSFSAAVCAGQITALPLTAWKLGVFDAQLDGRFVTRVGNLPISLDALEQKARSLAAMRNTGGFAYGLCTGNTRGWVMALPAPAPAQREAEHSWLLPRAALMARCASFHADFAASKGGRPRVLPTHRGHLSTAGLPAGVVSLTCQPKSPRWQGPVLWALYPVGEGPEPGPPEADSLNDARDAGRLLSWINKLREREQLAPLAPNTALDTAASNLAADDSLTHNRTLIQSAARDLRERRIEVLAEDRVRAADVKTMAWLLWHSPRHRESLLNPLASVLGISSRAVGDEQLAVLVTGSASSPSMARRPKTGAAAGSGDSAL